MSIFSLLFSAGKPQLKIPNLTRDSARGVFGFTHFLCWELRGISAHFFVITNEVYEIDFLPFLQWPCRTPAVSDRQLCLLPRAVFSSIKYPFFREHLSSLDVCFTVRFVHDYVNVTLCAFLLANFTKALLAPVLIDATVIGLNSYFGIQFL
jgi:hypothetical protein